MSLRDDKLGLCPKPRSTELDSCLRRNDCELIRGSKADTWNELDSCLRRNDCELKRGSKANTWNDAAILDDASTLCTAVSKNMWISVDKAAFFVPLNRYVDKYPVNPCLIHSLYTSEPAFQRHTEHQLNKKLDRLSPFPQCLLLRLIRKKII